MGGARAIYAVPLVLMGVYFLIDGTCAIIAGIKFHSAYKRGWLLVADGVLRLIFMLVLVFLGEFGPLALMLLVAGIVEIVAAIRLRKYVKGTLWLGLAGVAGVLFIPLAIGLLSLGLDLNPINAYGGHVVVFGALLLAFGFLMRGSVRTSG